MKKLSKLEALRLVEEMLETENIKEFTPFIIEENSLAFLIGLELINKGEGDSNVIGLNPEIVDKATGKIFNILDAFNSHEISLEKYSEFKEKMDKIEELYPDFHPRKEYRICISEVFDIMNLTNQIYEMGAAYIIPEIHNGILIKEAKSYDKIFIKQRLETIPAIFNLINPRGLLDLFYFNTIHKICKFKILNISSDKVFNERITLEDFSDQDFLSEL